MVGAPDEGSLAKVPPAPGASTPIPAGEPTPSPARPPTPDAPVLEHLHSGVRRRWPAGRRRLAGAEATEPVTESRKDSDMAAPSRGQRCGFRGRGRRSFRDPIRRSDPQFLRDAGGG